MRSISAAFAERFRALAKLRLAFAHAKFRVIFRLMQSQNGARSQARTLRDHLSQTVNAKQAELERKLGKSSPSNSRDELVAEVSQEAADLDYERWDGLS